VFGSGNYSYEESTKTITLNKHNDNYQVYTYYLSNSITVDVDCTIIMTYITLNRATGTTGSVLIIDQGANVTTANSYSAKITGGMPRTAAVCVSPMEHLPRKLIF
jgi:hypothetical protein